MDENYWKRRAEEKEKRVDSLIEDKEKLEFKLLSLEQEKNIEINRLKGEIVEWQMKYHELELKPIKVQKEDMRKEIEEKVNSSVKKTKDNNDRVWQIEVSSLQHELTIKIDMLSNQVKTLTKERNSLADILSEKNITLAETKELLIKLRKEWLEYKRKKDMEITVLFEQLQQGLSHRLRSYLGTIQSTTQYCMKQWAKSKLKGHWQVIAKQTNNIAGLFDEVISMFPIDFRHQG